MSKQVSVTPAQASVPNGVEQIREILFGAHLKDYERRFAEQEERHATSLAMVHADLSVTCAGLDRQLAELRKTFEARLAAERASHLEQIERLTRQLAAVNERLDSRLKRSAEALGVTEALQGDVRRLRESKVDRNALADMFTGRQSCGDGTRRAGDRSK